MHFVPVTQISGRPDLTNSHNGNVPFHLCPPLKKTYASQAGQSCFGAFREQVLFVKEHNDDDNKKTCREMLTDWKATERSMPLLMKSNPAAKNDDIGKRRDAVTSSIGGRVMGYHDQLKCKAALPRFQNMEAIKSIQDAKENHGEKMVGGLHHGRQIVTHVNGLDRTEQEQLDSNKYMAWLGGQLTLQSQAHTGGFNKPRDVANQSYYDKVLADSGLSREQLEERKISIRQLRKERLGLLVLDDVSADHDETVEQVVRLKPQPEESEQVDDEEETEEEEEE